MIFTGIEIAAILFIHWIADFILQTHWQASNKSKRWDALLMHTGSYSIASMILIMCFYFIPVLKEFDPVNSIIVLFLLGFLYGLSAFIFHTITDYFTSRWTSKLYAKGDFHNFFVVIGFDQLLHYLQLFITYYFIFKHVY